MFRSKNLKILIRDSRRGNHFIEVGIDRKGNHYLVIHSGSRNLGVKICNYYQEKAVKNLSNHNVEIKVLIEKYRATGREQEIEDTIKALKMATLQIPKHLTYLEGQDLNDYLHDMVIVQEYARLNHTIISSIIMEKIGWKEKCLSFETIYNYIDIENQIL